MAGSPGPVRQSSDDAYAGLLPYLARNAVNNPDTGLSPLSGKLKGMLDNAVAKATGSEVKSEVDGANLRREIEGGSITINV